MFDLFSGNNKALTEAIKKILGWIFFLAVWSIGLYYIFTLDYSKINEPILEFLKTHFLTVWIVWVCINYLAGILVRKSGHMFIGPVSFILYPHFAILILYVSLHYHWATVLLTVVAISIGLIFIRKLEIKFSKHLRDRRADKILISIQSKTKKLPPYCLYLRSQIVI